ncbi:helix-turn-helix domain-containing protein [uncultured Hyphomonas sp.]|uniref:MarR family winged helix-turn-helix transcriptional regulator n=1 Tax=uncultured Hyphomonas sp. TaxID=225298 RepID=UPI002AAB3B5F|nr:helix-turn-helix domain-containing protein [uncultured Hyphomonas sp.]
MAGTLSRKDAVAKPAPSKSNEAELQDPLLMWELLRAFIWLDKGLQQNMEARGWPPLSRTESQVMLLVSVGIVRPIEVARNLGLTRQAINQTLSQLVDKKLVKLDDDPCDKRCKIVRFAREGNAMRRDGVSILRSLEGELARRGGRRTLDMLYAMEDWNWDAPPIFDKP